MKIVAALITALLLTGCAAKADTISFDRAALALTIADLGGPLRQACIAGKLAKDTCDDLNDADKAARKAIMTPAPDKDSTDAIVALLLKVGSAAARAYGFPVPSPGVPPKP